MEGFDLRHDRFREAARNIQRRAERQEYDEKLTKCFVPNRVLEELDTDQNQLVFGRRGVGKTHTLKVFLSKKVNEGTLCHYVDCTTFGSAIGQNGATSNIAIRFFSKFICELSNLLLDDASLSETPTSRVQDDLQTLVEQLWEKSNPDSDSQTFDYQGINRILDSFLRIYQAKRLFVLLDEWAQIPVSAQPFFAEFLKRSFFANPSVSMKIAVVDYCYKMNERRGENTIGLEKSADIFSDIHMDKFFLWDEDNTFVERFFAELLYNHLALESNADLDISPEKKLRIVLDDLFTQRKVFAELCRASEGNARDFLVLFGRAHSEFRKQPTRQKIGIDEIHTASVSWYRSDKYSNIVTERYLEDFLDYLVTKVIRGRKSKTFMVHYRDTTHPLLERLFSSRILHPLNTEWSHPDTPGERYNLITMDYGTYASFKGTKNEPYEKYLFEIQESIPDDVKEDLVPLDDRRSIRRIVVQRDDLERFWQRKGQEAKRDLFQ